MEFIDAHLHFGGKDDEIMNGLDIYPELFSQGLKKAYVLCFTTFGLDFSDFIKVAPYHARPHYHPEYADANTLLQKIRTQMANSDFIVPFLDFRIIHGDVESWIAHYMPFGYKGLKTLFIPEYDDFLKVDSPAEILGTTKENYLDWQQRVMEYGNKNNLPLICHLNLNNHFEYAKEFLLTFPQLRINFPHLGFSRKKISLLFDSFENCYSDISGLFEYIEKDPKGYAGYLTHYNNRIMFGSDCAFNEAARVKGYMETVAMLGLEMETEKKLLYDVAVNFLGM
ncbi:putative Amidohydrolase [uncultured Desulfobacterium sp.]|uniref:Putative Amidohydrolase n=1 Tax=uncultured Desulfobacterium sp. TaxID=201089 RepID=A0A445N0J3_9BACT|nr:putative Amidohydrolase [uncultured Desulfobacterium sp.]